MTTTTVSQLAARREAIISAMESLTRRGGQFGPREIDLFSKWENELTEIDRSGGSPFDVRHGNAFARHIRQGHLSPLTQDQHAALNEAQYRGTRLKYRNGRLVSETRATIGLEGTNGGAYPGSTAGFVVPLPFLKQIVSAAQYTAPWFEIADVQTTLTGAPLTHTQDNDLSVSAIAINEAATYSIQDVNLSSTVLGAFKWSSDIVKVSNELIQDAGIDLEDYLSKRFAARLMRGLDVKYLKGVGTTEPTGALTGLTASLTAQGSADTDSSSAANTIGLRDLVALEEALNPAYRPNAKWMMHPNTLGALRLVKDAEKRPVFESLNRPEGPILLGYPVVLSPQMDQLQASPSSPTVTKTTVAFGDWSYYKIRLVVPTLIRMTETQQFALNFQTGFVLNWRTDGALVDGASSNRAIVTMQNVY
jgi:HK97 family phage major capsid protein